jgi:hypothetical protein
MQFTPYAWNLRSAPILFAQIYSNMASCICALRSTCYCFSQIWVLSKLYAVGPTFMKSTPGLAFKSKNYVIAAQSCMHFIRENSQKLSQKHKWALWIRRLAFTYVINRLLLTIGFFWVGLFTPQPFTSW